MRMHMSMHAYMARHPARRCVVYKDRCDMASGLQISQWSETQAVPLEAGFVMLHRQLDPAGLTRHDQGSRRAAPCS